MRLPVVRSERRILGDPGTLRSHWVIMTVREFRPGVSSVRWEGGNHGQAAAKRPEERFRQSGCRQYPGGAADLRRSHAGSTPALPGHGPAGDSNIAKCCKCSISGSPTPVPERSTARRLSGARDARTDRSVAPSGLTLSLTVFAGGIVTLPWALPKVSQTSSNHSPPASRKNSVPIDQSTGKRRTRSLCVRGRFNCRGPNSVTFSPFLGEFVPCFIRNAELLRCAAIRWPMNPPPPRPSRSLAPHEATRPSSHRGKSDPTNGHSPGIATWAMSHRPYTHRG